jgi:hypothetical protein
MGQDGDDKFKVGQETGDRRRDTVNGRQGTGNRGQGTGEKRQEAEGGKREKLCFGVGFKHSDT